MRMIGRCNGGEMLVLDLRQSNKDGDERDT